MSSYSMRTYNSAGLYMSRSTPSATSTDSSIAEKELRDLGININAVRGQKTWRSVLFKDGEKIATCTGGRWSEVKR